MPEAKTIIAKFHPQAWQKDYAIAVDPEGETEWDVTGIIVGMGKHKALELMDDSYETDHLRNADNAPAWVRDWPGPFYVEVERSIADFYDD